MEPRHPRDFYAKPSPLKAQEVLKQDPNFLEEYYKQQVEKEQRGLHGFKILAS
jgi:hypothetical protein